MPVYLVVSGMHEDQDLSRFITAQEERYPEAMAEISSGRKRSHWMWYIFPQLKGLGSTEYSLHYGIKDLAEARAYLHHPVLGKRLTEISTVLLNLADRDAHAIFGSPDDLKLRSCMTLFSLVAEEHSVFSKVLDRFFEGKKDQKTLTLLGIL